MKIRRILLIICIPVVILFILFRQIVFADQAQARASLGTAAPRDTIGTASSLTAQSQILPSATTVLIQPSAAVQSMIDQVDQDTIYRIDGELSGQWPVLIDGQPYTISTRHTYSGPAISNTTRYVGRQLANLGLAVEYHQWDDISNPNVIGELTGRRYPGAIYLLTAHLDSTSPSWSSQAPGADDNASGTTAVLMAAEILSQYEWDCTLRFALWTGEEQGLRGSQAYAQRASDSAEQISGVLNLDMIGWNTQGSQPGLDLHASRNVTGSLELAQIFSNVVSAYEMALIPEIVPNPTNRSDHASFWQAGYPALLAIEDFADFNPYYHSVQDTLPNLDLVYFTEFVKASLGTLVHMADCLATGYLEGHVLADGSSTPIANASIRAKRAWLPPITLASDSLGYYSSTLPAGIYTLTASAIGYEAATVGNRPIFTNTSTKQDFYLTSRPPILLPLVRYDG